MRTLKSWCKRFAGVFSARKAQAHQDFDAELESHLRMNIEDNLRSGMSPEEARRQSILKLGGLEQTRQVYRQRATIPSLESLLQDVRFGWRILAHRPGFTLVVIVVLALGIGANTAMFSIINAVLLRPLPYKNSDRLVLVWQSSNQHRTTGEWFNTYREFEEWQSHSRSFEKLAALSWAMGGKSLLWHGKRHEVLAIPTSVDFFSMLGVAAKLGRTFEPADLNAGCTMVFSHTFWQDVLGAPTDLVGESIRVDQTECRVVGVMPKDFSFYPTQTALWTLITPNSPFVRDPWRAVTGVFGRLRPGISRSAAEAELETLERNILSEAPADLALPQAVPVVLDLQSEFTWLAGRNLQTALVVLFVAVFLVLLIGCVNVANLLLAQAVDRQRELAVRAALGAGRGRLIRQLLIESTLLSCGGGALGALIAYAAVRLFQAKTPVELPPGNPVEVNWQVLAFTALLAIVAAGLFGLVPAWRASRLDLNEALKEAGQSASQSRTARLAGSLVVAGEVGLSLILLAGAGLFLQSLAKLAATPLGFRTDHLLTGTVRLPEAKYGDPERRIQFFDRLRNQVAAIPGVQGVSLGSSLYLGGSNVLAVEGRTFARENAPHNVASEAVDNSFLQVMGIRLLRGRPFDTSDRKNTQQVAIVNQALADQYFPKQDPIGHQIKLGSPEDSRPWLTIVGVAANVKTTSVFQEMGYVVLSAVYRPLTQQPTASMSLLVRTSDDPNAVVHAVEQKVLAVDSDVTFANLKTMEETLFENQSQPRFRTILLSAFAVLALVLAALGIYGVLTRSVVRRTREIGIRMALGATRRSVMQMVLKQAFVTVLAGVAIGLVASVFLIRVIAQLLYMVRPDNFLTLSAVSALLVCVALLASYLPARRATRIDPLTALRNE